jgi:hypothetical protein
MNSFAYEENCQPFKLRSVRAQILCLLLSYFDLIKNLSEGEKVLS